MVGSVKNLPDLLRKYGKIKGLLEELIATAVHDCFGFSAETASFCLL